MVAGSVTFILSPHILDTFTAIAERLAVPRGLVASVSFSSPPCYLAVCINNDCVVYQTEV